MNQLETASAVPSAWLTSFDGGSSEPHRSPAMRADAAPTIGWPTETAPEETVPYVSPPPIPWTRVFTGF